MGNITCYHKTFYSLLMQTKKNEQTKQNGCKKNHESL